MYFICILYIYVLHTTGVMLLGWLVIQRVDDAQVQCNTEFIAPVLKKEQVERLLPTVSDAKIFLCQGTDLS